MNHRQQRRQNLWGYYYEDCDCRECQCARGHFQAYWVEADAQDNATRSAWRNNYIAGYYQCCEGEPIDPEGYCGQCGTRVNDAPYAFWLGAAG